MITLKSREELAILKRCGQIAASLRDELAQAVQPGQTTRELDSLAERLMQAAGVQPAFLGYRGYPARICTSVNEEVVHGIPGPRRLNAGDLLSIDLGIVHEGFVGDTAVTVPVGKVTPEVRRLLEITRKSLAAGIQAAQPGRHVGDISAAVQGVAERAGFGVVRDYVGHGIGRAMHEEPQVPNYGTAGVGARLEPGMVLCLEPMITMGTWQVRVLPDQWTVVTVDGRWACHLEEMVAITPQGPEVLSRPRVSEAAGRAA